MATFKQTLLALATAGTLAMGMASVAYADGPGDEGDSEWMAYLQSTAHGGGANLAMPGTMNASGPATDCRDVRAAPGSFARNIVAYCTTHKS